MGVETLIIAALVVLLCAMVVLLVAGLIVFALCDLLGVGVLGFCLYQIKVDKKA